MENKNNLLHQDSTLTWCSVEKDHLGSNRVVREETSGGLIGCIEIKRYKIPCSDLLRLKGVDNELLFLLYHKNCGCAYPFGRTNIVEFSTILCYYKNSCNNLGG